MRAEPIGDRRMVEDREVTLYGTSKREVSSATRRANASILCFGRLDVAQRLADDLADLARLASPKPRDVIAGEPMRMPLVTIGFLRIERDRVLVHGDARSRRDTLRPLCR